MLVLTRRENQSILIGPSIRVFVIECRDGSTKLGVEAPRDMVVLRDELLTKEHQKA